MEAVLQQLVKVWQDVHSHASNEGATKIIPGVMNITFSIFPQGGKEILDYLMEKYLKDQWGSYTESEKICFLQIISQIPSKIIRDNISSHSVLSRILLEFAIPLLSSDPDSITALTDRQIIICDFYIFTVLILPLTSSSNFLQDPLSIRSNLPLNAFVCICGGIMIYDNNQFDTQQTNQFDKSKFKAILFVFGLEQLQSNSINSNNPSTTYLYKIICDKILQPIISEEDKNIEKSSSIIQPKTLLWEKIKMFGAHEESRQRKLMAVDLMFRFFECYLSMNSILLFQDDIFWDVIKIGFVSTISQPRKQSIYLLKRILSLDSKFWINILPWDNKQWTNFFLIYETIQEYKPHLFQTVWAQLPTLFISSLASSSTSTSQQVKQLQSSHIDYWLEILFQIGLEQQNNFLKRVVFESFLQKHKEDQKVSISSSFHWKQSFVLGPLLRAITTYEKTGVRVKDENKEEILLEQTRQTNLGCFLNDFIIKSSILTASTSTAQTEENVDDVTIAISILLKIFNLMKEEFAAQHVLFLLNSLKFASSSSSNDHLQIHNLLLNSHDSKLQVIHALRSLLHLQHIKDSPYYPQVCTAALSLLLVCHHQNKSKVNLDNVNQQINEIIRAIGRLIVVLPGNLVLGDGNVCDYYNQLQSWLSTSGLGDDKRAIDEVIVHNILEIKKKGESFILDETEDVQLLRGLCRLLMILGKEKVMRMMQTKLLFVISSSEESSTISLISKLQIQSMLLEEFHYRSEFQSVISDLYTPVITSEGSSSTKSDFFPQYLLKWNATQLFALTPSEIHVIAHFLSVISASPRYITILNHPQSQQSQHITRRVLLDSLWKDITHQLITSFFTQTSSPEQRSVDFISKLNAVLECWIALEFISNNVSTKLTEPTSNSQRDHSPLLEILKNISLERTTSNTTTSSNSSTSSLNSNHATLISSFSRNKWHTLSLLVPALVNSSSSASSSSDSLLKSLLKNALEATEHIDWEGLEHVLTSINIILDHLPLNELDIEFVTNDILSLVWSAHEGAKRHGVTLVSAVTSVLYHKNVITILESSTAKDFLLIRSHLNKGIDASLISSRFAMCFAIQISKILIELPNFGSSTYGSDVLLQICLLPTSTPSTSSSSNDDNSSTSSFASFYLINFILKNKSLKELENTKTKLFINLLKLNFDNTKEYHKREYSTHTLINKQKLSLWRCLCILLPHISNKIINNDDQLNELLWKTFLLKNHSNIRYLIQIFLINLCVRFTSDVEDDDNHFIQIQKNLIKLLKDYNLEYQFATSLMIITSYVILSLLDQQQQRKQRKENQDQMIITLVELMFPWINHYNHAARVTAQVLLQMVLQKLNSLPSSSKIIMEKLIKDPYVNGVYEFLNKNKVLSRMKSKQQYIIDNFSPIKLCDFILTNEEVGQHKENSSNSINQIFELDEQNIEHLSLIDNINRCLRQLQQDLHLGMVDPTDTTHQQDSSSTSLEEEEENLLTVFQKRDHSSFSLIALESLRTAIITGNAHQQHNHLLRKRHNVCVVGSLLENIPNIAGLARTCEIFNVLELTIPNKKLIDDPNFKRVSMAAEKQLNLCEVTSVASNVIEYILDQKKKGFVIIGIEQTPTSISLAKIQFPKKCVFVLGQERTGMPPELLQVMDVCVEIPQYGTLGSLNAHVSGSIILWEYTKQHYVVDDNNYDDTNTKINK